MSQQQFLEFEFIDLNRNYLEEEDETFVENGIVVEMKYDLNEQERLKYKTAKLQQKFYGGPNTFQPQNIAQFLFFDENGQIFISEENVKTFYTEFTQIMTSVHKGIREKY
mmetsp:Transcript_10560/g.17714  ORF Transcript_10560/g.17714 Transcript_10560/m.17714 type:complete len:110 (+) Transcript_10560:721-1050(+)